VQHHACNELRLVVVTQPAEVSRGGINRITAVAYEDLLQRLLIAERAPAWFSNQLRRVVQQPKRYVIDAALVVAALCVDVNAAASKIVLSSAMPAELSA
jgi:uncharacterized protein